jgi:hypothetical protein
MRLDQTFDKPQHVNLLDILWKSPTSGMLVVVADAGAGVAVVLVVAAKVEPMVEARIIIPDAFI